MFAHNRVALRALLLLAAVVAAALPAAQALKQKLPFPKEIDEDFSFELRNLYTDRQRGARINIFVKYRYYTPAIDKSYTTETGTFDFREVEKLVRAFVPAGGKGVPGDAYWEVLNREIAKAVWARFPIRGLSIRIESQGMSEGGLPDHNASVFSLGDIEPWVSNINHFPGCDGMDTEDGNSACRLYPTWKESDPNLAKIKAAAKQKAGKHDKPEKCDFCA